MPEGYTTVDSLADSLEVIIDSARSRREYPATTATLAERHKLEDNKGLSWSEIEVSRLSAQGGITEATILDNPQEWSDIIRTVTPTITGITTFISRRSEHRLNKMVLAQLGSGMMDAIERKRDLDGIATLDGATNSNPGAGATMSSGVISADVSNIQGNTTEGATFAHMGFLYIQGMDLITYAKEVPKRGGGGTQKWIYDEYAFAERLSNSTSVFIRENYSDAPAPTT